MSSRSQWDPLSELSGIRKAMNRLFDSAMVRSDFEDGSSGALDAWHPLCDVFESDTAVEVQLELPGLSHDAIDVSIDGDELVVRGERARERGSDGERYHRVERAHGRFSRRVRLPSTVDRGAVSATYRHGVLHVRVPKREGDQPGSVRVSID